jgi:ribosomal protein S18 acetylase RimI-like enzyme
MLQHSSSPSSFYPLCPDSPLSYFYNPETNNVKDDVDLFELNSYIDQLFPGSLTVGEVEEASPPSPPIITKPWLPLPPTCPKLVPPPLLLSLASSSQPPPRSVRMIPTPSPPPSSIEPTVETVLLQQQQQHHHDIPQQDHLGVEQYDLVDVEQQQQHLFVEPKHKKCNQFIQYSPWRPIPHNCSKTDAFKYWANKLVYDATVNGNKDREFVLSSPSSPSLPEEYEMEHVPGSRLCNLVVEELLLLTRSNMKPLYDAIPDAQWKWNDLKKRGELRNDRMQFILLRQADHQLVGFVAFQFLVEAKIPHTYISELQVNRLHRQHGFGTILTNQVMDITRQVHLPLVLLTVQTNNSPAFAFYSRFGFQVDETSPGKCYNLTKGTAASYELLSLVLDGSKICPRQCTSCVKRFRFEDSLRNHQSVEHEVQWPCPCPQCPLGTMLPQQLIEHQILVHGMTRPSPSSLSLGLEVDPLQFARIELKSQGRLGTVIKPLEKGLYTVRMDGNQFEVRRCRPKSFVVVNDAYEEEELLPVNKRIKQ